MHTSRAHHVSLLQAAPLAACPKRQPHAPRALTVGCTMPGVPNASRAPHARSLRAAPRVARPKRQPWAPRPLTAGCAVRGVHRTPAATHSSRTRHACSLRCSRVSRTPARLTCTLQAVLLAAWPNTSCKPQVRAADCGWTPAAPTWRPHLHAQRCTARFGGGAQVRLACPRHGRAPNTLPTHCELRCAWHGHTPAVRPTRAAVDRRWMLTAPSMHCARAACCAAV